MINRKRLEEIYDRLPGLVVELDNDPVSRGPDYIQELIATVRRYLNEVSVYQQEVLRLKSYLESEYGTANASFEVASSDLMANDERVSRLPSIQDRKAMVNVILNVEYTDVLKKKQALNEIGYVDKAIQHRSRELDNTMSAVRLQAQVLKADMRTGAFYGDDNDKSRGDSWSDPADDISSDEIARLMGEAQEEQEAEKKKSESKPKPEKSGKKTKKTRAKAKIDEPVDENVQDLLGDFGDLSPDEDVLLCGECGEALVETEGSLVCGNGHGESPDPEPEPEKCESVEESVEVEAGSKDGEDPDVSAFLDDEDDFSDVLDGL